MSIFKHHTLLYFLCIFILLLLLLLRVHGLIASAQDDNSNESVINIGAILDFDSRNGKEAKIAMEIAVQNFNNMHSSSRSYKLVLKFRNSSRDNLLRSASTANELIKELQTRAIIGMETWKEAALVAQVGNQAKVPILSLVTPAIAPPSMSLRWPFLVRMATNESNQMRCLANIIQSYRWRRVITINEADNGESGATALLYKALQEVGSKIEYQMAFPPFSSLQDPKSAIHEEFDKLNSTSTQSRVFIVLQSSLPLANYLFTEAKQMGMMDQDSVWITTETITSLLNAAINSSSVNISSMQGVIGIKTFSKIIPSFKDIYTQFQENFQYKYPKEDYFEPGIYSLRAYDAISVITQAMGKLSNNDNSSKMLMEIILSSNFSGLSGNIRFKDGELSDIRGYQIVNVVEKSYKTVGFWSPEYGFSRVENGNNSWSMDIIMDRAVNWPGGLKRNPKGWAMPTDTKPMRIGVPRITMFDKFVKVETIANQSQPKITGFCIDLFEAAIQELRKEYNLNLNYMLVPFNGSYDELIGNVSSKDFYAAVGDFTILADRTKNVEFTQPYMRSGLSMIVPIKSESKTVWMFVKPFDIKMWIVTIVIFLYTMFIVWFLEHRSNPEFQGPWRSQLSTALWFIFSTIFFSHRERLQSNFTRVVIVVWLFVVLILTQSYTASLTSMFTVKRLEPPKLIDLQINNSKVGCVSGFVCKYLEDILHFDPVNLVNISYDCHHEFQSGIISAAFLELPNEKIFLTKYCNKYMPIERTYKFGGYAFVFQKGSPLAIDISEAILKLSENGTIRKLEDKLYDKKYECFDPKTSMDSESLSLKSLWTLLLITGGTSTIMFLLFLVQLIRKFKRQREAYGGNISQTLAQELDFRNVSSLSSEYIIVHNTPERPQVSPLSEIEMLNNM